MAKNSKSGANRFSIFMPVDKSLVNYARRLLDSSLDLIVELLGERATGQANLTRHEKTLIAEIYRNWIDELHTDPQFGYFVSQAGAVGETTYINDRVFTHNVIVEAIRQVGASKAPHLLKKMQDDFSRVVVSGYEFGALYVPKEKNSEFNSGDTIFCFEYSLDESNSHQVIGIADVSGKSPGVKDALDTKSYILLSADQCNCDLAQLYNLLNETLCERFMHDEESYGFSRSVGSVAAIISYQRRDTEIAAFEAINAGHEPPLIYDSISGRFIEISQDNMLLGVLSMKAMKEFGIDHEANHTMPFSKGQYYLRKGDILLLYSDGLIHSVDPNRVQYGIERVKKIVHKNASRTASDIAEIIHSELDSFINGERYDDVSLVVIKNVGVK